MYPEIRNGIVRRSESGSVFPISEISEIAPIQRTVMDLPYEKNPSFGVRVFFDVLLKNGRCVRFSGGNDVTTYNRKKFHLWLASRFRENERFERDRKAAERLALKKEGEFLVNATFYREMLIDAMRKRHRR
jgi:hypothetical protein